MAADTPVTRDAGNIYVGDEVTLPGDIVGTVTDLQPLNGEWMRLVTDMGTIDVRMSDQMQVVPAASKRRTASAAAKRSAFYTTYRHSTMVRSDAALVAALRRRVHDRR